MLRNEDIICLSTMSWDFLWTRKQRFMEMLAGYGNRILYVEPINSITNLYKRREETTSGLGSRVKEVKKNVFVLTPSLMLPAFGRVRALDRINQRLLEWVVVKWQKRLKFDFPILWVYSPKTIDILDSFPRKLLIYDCVDEHSAYPGVKNKSLVQNWEKRLLEDADIVFTSAKGLYEDKKQYNQNTFFVPNGVDVEHFAEVQNPDLEIAAEMKKFSKPILGFVGGIYQWVDLDLIKYVARANPRWTVTMIGPMGPEVDVSLFSDIKNVYFLGTKDREILPQYVKAFDVCLNVFKRNELSRTVNPLKVYEYLAAGKPVISVDMPEIRHLSDVVYIAKSYEHFLSQIKAALAENNSKRVAEKMKVSKEYSWEKLLSTVSQKIEGFLTSAESRR